MVVYRGVSPICGISYVYGTLQYCAAAANRRPVVANRRPAAELLKQQFSSRAAAFQQPGSSGVVELRRSGGPTAVVRQFLKVSVA